MQHYRYPSEAFPPAPSFAIALPESWTPDEAPDCVASFNDSTVTGEFRANVLISTSRVEKGHDLKDIADAAIRAARAAFRELSADEPRDVRVGGEPALLLRMTFLDPRFDEQFSQVQVLFFAPDERDHTRDLIHVYATCLAADAARYSDVFDQVAGSFRFTRGEER